MKRNLIITIFILTVIVTGSNFAWAQPGSGFGMMESIDSEYEFLIKMIPHQEEAVYNANNT